ncbi:MAG: hypothetical protein ACYTAS_24755, partial [Planctomycetota bacterium]
DLEALPWRAAHEYRVVLEDGIWFGRLMRRRTALMAAMSLAVFVVSLTGHKCLTRAKRQMLSSKAS